MIPMIRNCRSVSLAISCLVMPLTAAEEAEKGFTPLFDGKTMTDWKASGNPEAFKVEDGAIVTKGDCSHAFYVGKFQNAKFANYELRLDVMTREHSNGGVFINTEFQEKGWPAKGYEIQVNNTQSDWKKSGGVYNFQDNKVPLKDNEWMHYVIRVEGGKVVVTIDGKEISNFTPKEGESRLTKEGGAIALQAHDKNSTVLYKNIRIKPLD